MNVYVHLTIPLDPDREEQHVTIRAVYDMAAREGWRDVATALVRVGRAVVVSRILCTDEWLRITALA